MYVNDNCSLANHARFQYSTLWIFDQKRLNVTANNAKTIQIYLPTGEPRGIRIADITTRIVLSVAIPRTELAVAKQRSELDHPGVYFLFGEDEDSAKPIVYIGQTEDARKRLDDHNKCKPFWKTAVFCLSKSQNFTQAHIRYLEWYCLQQAKEIGRFELDNDQVSFSPTHVTEPMKAELHDVFDTIRMLIGTLGFPVFDPIAKQDSHTHLFFARGGGSDGSGELVADGFVVLKGSRARIEIAPSAIASVKPHRDKLIAAGILTEQNGEYIFTQDFEFPTPSAAAAVVLGRTANGWIEWVDESKRSLDDVYRKSPEAS